MRSLPRPLTTILLAALMVCLLGPTALGSDWPTYRHDNAQDRLVAR